MSTKVTSTSEGGEVNQQDAQFIIECLRSLDQDKNVNLNKVGAALGYTNTASVGNRFRAIRKRYGFENFDSTAKLPNANTTSSPATSPTSGKGKGKGKGSSAGGKKSAPKSAELEDHTLSDGSEAETIIAADAPKVKAKKSPKKVARKGAKVANTPIPATGHGAGKTAALLNAKDESPTVKAEDMNVNEEEGIAIPLLKAVDEAVEELEGGEIFNAL